MQRTILRIAVVSSLVVKAFAQGAPAKDREAILAMAGSYQVEFHFHETVPIAKDYSLKKKPYVEHATEIIEVAENTPERITLQNLLVVHDKKGKSMVIKHWAQVWTWQDTQLLDYCGSEEDHSWKKITLTAEQAAGTWSQLVTQTDDSPRYEGYGKWVHENGDSYWSSQPTRRPLPRREYTKRDDYDYLLVTNRHTITPQGWVHEQDNRKVVDRKGAPIQTLCHEFGINTYRRCDTEHATVASQWWKENGPYWNEVRNFWIDAGNRAKESFSYTTMVEDRELEKVILDFEKSKPQPDELRKSLQAFIIIDQ